MVLLHTIKPDEGSRFSSKRVGRGNGSGKGTFSTRGCKGQNARSGGGVPDWFEGGQTPLFRRLPKLKGFSNARFTTKYNVINLSDVEAFAAKGVTEISTESLVAAGLLKRKSLPLKLLAKGELKAKVQVKVQKASEAAKKAIEKAGGSIELV